MGGSGSVPSSVQEGSNTHIETTSALLKVPQKVQDFLQREEEMHFFPISYLTKNVYLAAAAGLRTHGTSSKKVS